MFVSGINSVSLKINNSLQPISNPIKKQNDEKAGYEKVTASLWGNNLSNVNPSYFYGAFIPNFGRESNNPANMDKMEADTQSGFKLSQLKHDIACPDCGGEIMTKPIFTAIKNEIENADEDSYISTMKKHTKYMMEQEKKILSILEQRKQENPEKTIAQIVKDERAIRLAPLEDAQNEVLTNLSNFVEESLSSNDKQKVTTLLDETRTCINARRSDFAFQRGVFISKLASLDVDNKENQEKMLEIAYGLPSSISSEDSWFVKYGGLTKHKKPYTSEKICEKLVSPTYTNTDHIHPWNLGGLDAVSNFWLMHARCNIIKSDKPFEEWLNEDKEGRTQYIKSYLTQAQEAIDNNPSKKFHPKYDNYAAKVAKTMYDESKGKVDFTKDFPMPEEKEEKESKRKKVA